MFAHKSRLKTITHISWMVSRVLLSIIIMSNMFIPIGASADSSSAESADIDSVKNVSEDIANEITLGNSNIPKDTEVPILSEQIAKQAQQKQEEKTVRLRVEAEPAIYTPGQPIRLHWMIEDLKPQDVANAEIVFHAPAGFMPTDPNPVYTPDGLVRIPLSSQTEFSEWNVPADAELPIYFTLDLLINDDLITSQTVMVNQASFAIEKNVRGILGGANGKLAGMNGKVEVEVPANAIDESLYLDIRTPAPQTQPGISLTWQPLEIIAVGKDSRKNVEKFKAPIKIRVKYEESQFPNGDEKALTVYYYDQDVRDWFPIETTVDTENNILTAYSDHLTVFDYKINNWQSQSLPTLDEFKAADFTGAGTYAINLWTPPGPNGLEPALALSYNSQIIDESSAYTQASWVGMGWSLETGSITRNMHGTDTNSQDDTFTISAGGVSGLLLPISSVVNGGVITTTYNTAEQSFMKVENTITINSNTWVATTTDGTRYEFANVARTSITDTDGCSTAAQLDLVWRWSLTSVTSPRVRDASNNPIALTYTYDVEKKSAGCYNDIAVYPLSISYPNGKYSVNFVTESRNDYQTSWTQNASRTLYGTKRLKGILVKHLGITVRRYDLIYASNTSTGNVIYPNFKWSNNNAKTLTLWGVQEFANDTNNPALPAVTFFYGDDLHLTSVANGQGGLVELSYTPWTYYHSDYYNRRSLSTSFGNPSSQDPECVYSNGAWTVGTAWTWVSGPGPASTVGCYLEGSNKYLRVGDGPAGNTAMARRSIPENLAKPGGTYGLYIVGQPFVSPVDEIYWGYREWSTGVEWSRHLYNVPGIGFPDSLVMPVTINPSDTYLFLQCSDCKLTDYHFYLHTTIYRVETRTVSISPINTVAKIYTYHYDNLAPNTFDNSAAVASGGALYFQNESELRGNAMSQVVNSDGLATINWFYQTDALKGRIYDTLIMEQTPASFDGFDSINEENWSWSGWTPEVDFPPYSFDLAAMVTNPDTNGNRWFGRNWADLTSGKMAVAHIRLGEENALENNVQGKIGLLGSGGQFFGINFQSGTAVASNGTTLLSAGNFIKDEWYGVMFFLDAVNGSRMRIWQLDDPNNFGETVISGVGAGYWSLELNIDDGIFWLDSYFEGVPYTETITRYNTTVHYNAAAVNDNNLIPSPIVFQDLQVVWNTIASVEQRNYNGDASFAGTKQVYEYDTVGNFGNLLRQTDFVNNNGAVSAYRGVKYEYYPNSAAPAYLLSLPARQVTLDCTSGSCDFTNLSGKQAETYFFYDGSTSYSVPPTKGELTRQRTWVKNSEYSQSNFTYYTNGNLKDQIAYTEYATAAQTGDPADPQITTTAYDVDGYNTYPVSITNALGQVTLTGYDYRFGLPNSVTAPSGAQTSALYDDFGRLTSITAPLDNPTTLQVTYHDSQIPFQVDLTQTVDAGASIRVSRFYDGVGRQIQTQTVGAVVNGVQKNVVMDYAYDSQDRLIKQSIPNVITYAGSPSFRSPQDFMPATITTYDLLGRIQSVDQPNQNAISYTYTDLTTTMTDPKQFVTTTAMDVWGRTTFIDAPEGPDVTYTYDVLNQMKTAVRGGKTTTIEYDAAGRKLEMTDPDMGHWVYQYDALGNLKVQTDNRNCALALGYDALNRLVHKVSNGTGCGQSVNNHYYYDSDDPATGAYDPLHANQNGYRTYMTDASGATAWVYDIRGRLFTEIKIIGSQTYTSSWTYNSADLPVAMTYPDGEVLTYGYNSDGSLNSVISSLGDTYLASTRYDESGRITGMDYGANLLRKTFNYFPVDTPTNGDLLNSAVTTRLADNATLQSLAYTYDKNANVQTIIDALAGPQTQSFGYDSLNRLTSASVSGGTDGLYSETYQYDPTSGNLSVKGGLNLSYNDPSHAHAVTNAGTYTYTYDANGNMIQRAGNAQSFDLAYDAENRLVSVNGTGGVPATATPTNTPLGPTPTFTSTPDPSGDLIFADGFESGDLSAWSSNNTDLGDLSVSMAAALVGNQGLQALIDNSTGIYVNDDTPNAEPRYRARFYFDPNSIAMASTDAHFIFKGYSDASTDILRVEFRPAGGAYELRAGLRSDSASWANTSWFALGDTVHFIELDWRAATAAGANNGGLTFWIDGTQRADLTGTDNDTLRVNQARLGPLSAVDSGTNGTTYFDAFESRRYTYIGPVGQTPTSTPTATSTTLTSTPTGTNTPTATSTAGSGTGTTFTVTKTDDTNDGACDGDCSLREAVRAANALSGMDTILLPAGTYTLSITGADANAAKGDLDVTEAVSILGQGNAANTIVAAGPGLGDRVFEVISSSGVMFSNFTIRNGVQGAGAGGGLRATGSSLTLSRVVVSGNQTGTSGGGIYVQNGSLAMSNSAVINNSADFGGGILNDSAALTLTNVTISGNSSVGSGGGLRNNNTGTVDLVNVTVSNNIADSNVDNTGDGGGLYISAGVVTLKNTILAGNLDNSTTTVRPDCSGTLTSLGYNLIGNPAGCTVTAATGDLFGTSGSPLNPQLGVLQENGGNTFTQALLSGSPAINVADGAACPTTDQRGYNRVSTCDMGAYEFDGTTGASFKFASYNPAPAPQSGPLTFMPVDDAYIASGSPSTNYGSAITLQTDNSPVKHFLLKFSVTGVNGQSIANAKIRLYNTDSSSKGGNFYRVSDSSWQEGTVTWNNAPATDPTVLASLNSVSANNWYEVDVTSLITGDGTYSLRVASTSSDGADFSSQEGANSPELVVTLGGTPVPSSTPTMTPMPTFTPTPTGIVTAPFSNATFVYDGDGKRVKSVFNNNSLTTYFVGTHYEVAGAVVTKYYYAGDFRVAMRTNSTLNFLLGDHLGSASITTDAAGNVISELRYKAWGEERYASGSTPTNYTYTGQYSYTDDFGLMYYGARWYDPTIGRFNQPDVNIPGNQGVQAWDRYAYVNNNPILYTDPSGKWLETAFDLLSLAMTINDIRNEGFTVMNTISLVTDVASVILPVVPAGVSHAIRAAKYANKAMNAVDTAADTIKAVDKATDAAKTANKLDNVSDAGKGLNNPRCRGNSFSAETQVVTLEGDTAIASIQIGDYVLAWNEADGTLGYYQVTDTIHHTDEVIIHLILDGEWIETTPEHPFYVEDEGWVEAEDLRIGDQVRQADGTTGTVWLQWAVSTLQEMYNLSVDTAHTFFVGEGQWLVHNCNSTTLSQNLGGTAGDNLQAHHLIPCEHACHPFVNRAKNAGWNMDEAYNGILLPSNSPLAKTKNLPVHRGPHANYSDEVERKLDRLEILARQNKWKDEVAFQKLKSTAGDFRSRIVRRGGKDWIK